MTAPAFGLQASLHAGSTHHHLTLFQGVYLGAGVLVAIIMAALVLMLWLSGRQGD